MKVKKQTKINTSLSQIHTLLPRFKTSILIKSLQNGHCCLQISGSSVIWYHYMTGQPLDQDHVILHYFEVGDDGGIRMLEKTYDG